MRGTRFAAMLMVLGATPLMAEPDYIDPQLDGFPGLYVEEANVAPGQWYWRLVTIEYENEFESGGQHHIFFKALNASGQPIENQEVWGAYSTGCTRGVDCTEISQFTKGPVDGYWANFAMFGSCAPGPYGAWVDEAAGPSDAYWGMGMHNPTGTPCNAHVNFRLTWQWTQAVAVQPILDVSTSSISRIVTEGENLTSDSFTVGNTGGGTANYTISESVPWLSVSPTAGSSSGPGNSHSIDYMTAGLTTAGSPYSTTITVSDPSASNSPQTINVQVEVVPIIIPGDFDGDGDVDMIDYGAFQACFSGNQPQLEPTCTKARFDGDVDVDHNDLSFFMGCMSGANMIGDPGCAG